MAYQHDKYFFHDQKLIDRKMKTKDEFSNEDIARALGWVDIQWDGWVTDSRYQKGHHIGHLPDFKNDMNAATKYVWPALMEFYHNTLAGWSCNGPGAKIAFEALQSPNPSLVLCEAFMKLHGEK